jgi:hypothetical protein
MDPMSRVRKAGDFRVGNILGPSVLARISVPALASVY